MDEETREYIEDGKLIMLDDRIDTREALNCLEDFEEEETDRCAWCGDYFPIEDLNKEKDMGYLCDHCRMSLQSRGEELEFEDEYLDIKHRRDESLNESSMLIDSFLISDSENIRIYWDKYEGYVVERLYRQGDELWKTVFKKTFHDEASAKRYFNRAKKKFGVNESVEDEYDESLNEEKKDDKIKIKIEVIVSNDLDEKIVSGNPEDKYDEQTLEDWYDFASNVEGLIDQKFFVNNISLSKQPESLSEYIDFYRKDEEGNRKEGIVDLRLSDHVATTNARRNRINKVKKIDPNYKLVSVIVNERQFYSYDEALEYVKKLLNDLNK